MNSLFVIIHHSASPKFLFILAAPCMDWVFFNLLLPFFVYDEQQPLLNGGGVGRNIVSVMINKKHDYYIIPAHIRYLQKSKMENDKRKRGGRLLANAVGWLDGRWCCLCVGHLIWGEGVD